MICFDQWSWGIVEVEGKNESKIPNPKSLVPDHKRELEQIYTNSASYQVCGFIQPQRSIGQAQQLKMAN